MCKMFQHQSFQQDSVTSTNIPSIPPVPEPAFMAGIFSFFFLLGTVTANILAKANGVWLCDDHKLI